jgi:hypothetical protein
MFIVWLLAELVALFFITGERFFAPTSIINHNLFDGYAALTKKTGISPGFFIISIVKRQNQKSPRQIFDFGRHLLILSSFTYPRV